MVKLKIEQQTISRLKYKKNEKYRKECKRHLGHGAFGKEEENKAIGQKPYLKELAKKYKTTESRSSTGPTQGNKENHTWTH